MKTLKEFMNESILSKAKQIIKKIDFALDADTRTPKEIQQQIRSLSDEVLKQWAETADGFGSGRKMLQGKIIKQEMKRRKLS